MTTTATGRAPYEVDLIVCARYVVPVVPASIFVDHCVVVRDGVIVDVLASETALKCYQAIEVVDLGASHAIFPGFVNARTHAAMMLAHGMDDSKTRATVDGMAEAGFAGGAADEYLVAISRAHFFPLDPALVSPELVAVGTRLAMLAMLRSGTTCFADAMFFGDALAAQARAARMRCVVTMPISDAPSAYASSAEESISKALALPLKHTAWEDTTAFHYGLPDLRLVGNETCERVRALAARTHTRIHVPVNRNVSSIERCVRAHGRTPLERLSALELLGPQAVLVHCSTLSPAEVQCIAASGASVVYTPESDLRERCDMCPVLALLQAGVAVALASDGGLRGNSFDMIGTARLAGALQNSCPRHTHTLSGQLLVRMATLNAAAALGLAERIGSLERGKQADFVALALDPITAALYADPAQALADGAITREHVTDVWIHGERVLATGKAKYLDEAGIVAEAREWRTNGWLVSGLPAQRSATAAALGMPAGAGTDLMSVLRFAEPPAALGRSGPAPRLPVDYDHILATYLRQ